MKLVRYGAFGQEKPGLVDTAGKLRDLWAHVSDIAGAALKSASLAKLKALSPESLPLVDGAPRIGACVGDVRNFIAVGLNFADTYFRTGFYPIPLPSGIGVEAAGIVEAVGDGVTNVKPGDRVTYTGFVNTLGAYSTERLIPAAPLVKLPPAISCETAAAMTMRGLTSAYLMRRIWPLKEGDAILLRWEKLEVPIAVRAAG